MKKFLLFLLLGASSLTLSSCGYNTLVTLDEEVSGQWANVEAAYQRRADLIPNLVNTVKGYADFEKSTLMAVTEARSKATSMQIDPSKLDEKTLAQFEQNQNALKGALSRLLVVMEKYPDLKANQNFLELQSQLEGTENRINVERRRFNELVQTYNGTLRRFPNNLTAGIFGFKTRAYFKSESGSEKAPQVQF
jgi:LemA protein